MPLTDAAIKKLEPKDKRYVVSDGRGLSLEVHTNGSKYWFMRYWVHKKEKRKHLGRYPDISLREAREMALDIRKELLKPAPARMTFGQLAEEWVKVKMSDKKPSYIESINMRLRLYILPEIKDFPISEITSGVILDICRKLEQRKTIETAHRVKALIGQIMRYAIATDRMTNDPTFALKNALTNRTHKHMAAITKPSDVAVLMKNIYSYPRTLIRYALLFSAFTFCRPGEIRHAEWSEIDFENKEWRIPAEKMKMKRTHIVPLARQVIELLKNLKELTGGGKYLFPSARGGGRPMSENAIRVALRSMGYSNDEMTAHGFRAMASTRLNEMGWRPDVIERQLAHAPSNAVRAAYNHAEYFEDRKKMMQFWADYLEGLV